MEFAVLAVVVYLGIGFLKAIKEKKQKGQEADGHDFAVMVLFWPLN